MTRVQRSEPTEKGFLPHHWGGQGRPVERDHSGHTPRSLQGMLWRCRKRRHNIPQRFPPHQGMKRFSVGSEQSCVGSASRTDAQISITLLVVLFILLLVLRKYIWAGLGFKKRSLIVSNSLICLENYTIWGLKSLKSLKWDVSNSILRARKIKSKDRVRARINVG